MRIGVTHDAGLDDESVLTARALESLGEVTMLAADRSLPTQLRDTHPDIVFNLARGAGVPSRRLHVPAFLEFFGIPFSGSDAVTHAACVERSRMKEAMAYHGIPTPSFAMVDSVVQLAPLARRAFPMAARRSRGVSSCFATLVAHDFDELESIVAELLAASSEPVLVERFLPGPAFACSVLGNGADAVTLPVVGIRHERFAPVAPLAGECPARISDGLAEDIAALALRAFHALGCRDVACVDIRLTNEGVPNVCGVDPLPPFAAGDDSGSLLSAARAAGVGDNELVQRCLVLAAERSGIDLPTAPAFERLPRRPLPGQRLPRRS